MENIPNHLYPTMFQSSSSNPQNPHYSLSSNTLDSHAAQPYNDNNIINGYMGLITSMDNAAAAALPPCSSTFSNPEEADDRSDGKKKADKKSKKPRYAFQTRSQVDILDDGYRWRKYGQKAVKNNKFPRSYYRCTYQNCNVKKQVQRLSKDEGVVVTTYEGVHTHPIDKPTDNFEHILSQMQIYTSI